MSAPVLKKVTVTFGPEAIEYAVCYLHTDEPGSPGTKTRTTRAATLARKGLEAALAGLDKGALLWGGFGTNTRQSTDRIMISHKRSK
jgi:hypothetical protein